jgi:SpoU rRNA methylase family enzyme
LLAGIFIEAIGRVGNDGVNGVFRLPLNPGKAIIVVQSRLPVEKRRLRLVKGLETFLTGTL